MTLLSILCYIGYKTEVNIGKMFYNYENDVHRQKSIDDNDFNLKLLTTKIPLKHKYRLMKLLTIIDDVSY